MRKIAIFKVHTQLHEFIAKIGLVQTVPRVPTINALLQYSGLVNMLEDTQVINIAQYCQQCSKYNNAQS